MSSKKHSLQHAFIQARNMDFQHIRETLNLPPARDIINQVHDRYRIVTEQYIDDNIDDYILGGQIMDAILGLELFHQGEREEYVVDFEQHLFEQTNMRERNPYNDSQNVHDPLIVKSTTNMSNELQTNNINNKAEILNEIRQHLKGAELKTFNKMLERDANITSMKKRESDVLVDVWMRQKIPGNNMELLKEAFINALRDSNEDGYVTCGVGCATRLVQSLNYVDKDFSEPVAPLSAVRNEIFSRMPNIETKEDMNNLFNEYKTKFPDYDFGKIEEECRIAIDMVADDKNE